jgi:hypothetical protein
MSVALVLRIGDLRCTESWHAGGDWCGYDGEQEILMIQTTHKAPFAIRSALLAVLIGVSGLAHAQNEPADPEIETEVEKIAETDDMGWVASLDLSAGFRAEADFDTPVGTIESTSLGGEFGLLIPIDDRARLKLSFGAEITEYDITPPAGAVGTTAGTVGTQFDTVTEFGFDALYSRAINADQSFFVGGGIGVAAEGGASDALVWNAIGGMLFRVNDRLRLGMGVGVFSQIEDDVRIVPLPQISYTIDDSWSIGTVGAGARLNYRWNPELNMGIKAEFDGSSFRIDDDNTLVPDGAVTMTGIPVSYYLDYSGGESSRVSLFAEVGVVLAGSMEIFNSSGVTVVDEDIDPGVFASVGVRIEF